MIRNLEAAQRNMRQRQVRLTRKQLQLQEAQEQMREDQEIQQAVDELLRTAEFRRRIEALFVEFGKTQEEAKGFWFRALFGPTISEIKHDFRVVEALRGIPSLRRILPRELRAVSAKPVGGSSREAASPQSQSRVQG